MFNSHFQAVSIISSTFVYFGCQFKISFELLFAAYNFGGSPGLLCPYLIDDGAKFKSDKLAKLARLLRIATSDMDNEKAVAAFSENIRQRLAKANLPARLKDLSVTIEQLALATEDTGNLDLMNHLPRSMSPDELFDFVKLAF